MRLLKYILVFVVMVLPYIGYSSHIEGSSSCHNAGISATNPSQIINFSTERLPGNLPLQIRHRSPHEVEETAVPDPAEYILYIIKLTGLERQYLASWKTYFYVQDDNRPQQQNYPPTHSLRGPPFEC